jgi:hypothetical protein
VFGYTNDAEDFLARVRRTQAAQFDAVDKVWRDADGMKIEDFGNADNLMIDATLIEQGRPVVRYAAPPNARFQDFTAFEACLRLAASARGAGTLVSIALAEITPAPAGSALT